jgi:hypothetical protein
MRICRPAFSLKTAIVCTTLLPSTFGVVTAVQHWSDFLVSLVLYLPYGDSANGWGAIAGDWIAAQLNMQGLVAHVMQIVVARSAGTMALAILLAYLAYVGSGLAKVTATQLVLWTVLNSAGIRLVIGLKPVFDLAETTACAIGTIPLLGAWAVVSWSRVRDDASSQRCRPSPKSKYLDYAVFAIVVAVGALGWYELHRR